MSESHIHYFFHIHSNLALYPWFYPLHCAKLSLIQPTWSAHPITWFSLYGIRIPYFPLCDIRIPLFSLYSNATQTFERQGHGSLTTDVKLRVAHALGLPGRFPRHRLQRKPLVSDPGMHHGTCVTQVPRCMSGSLTRSGGENVPGATRNFTYLTGGPLFWIGRCYGLLWTLHCPNGRYCDVTMINPLLFHGIRPDLILQLSYTWFTANAVFIVF